MIEQLLFIINILVISFFEIYLLVRYLSQKKIGMFIQNLIVYFVLILFLFYEHFSRIEIPNLIIFCTLITIIGHSFVGTYLDLYHRSKVYDRYLHLFGSFSFSHLTYSLLMSISPLEINKYYTFLFVLTLGTTIGVFFEIVEFMHDSLSKKPVCQHGLKDTDFDMIFNIIGSSIAGIVIIIKII